MYVCIYYLLILLSFDTDVIYNWQTNNVVITSIPIWIVSTINSKHKLWVTFIQVGLFLLSHSASVGARSRRGCVGLLQPQYRDPTRARRTLCARINFYLFIVL